MLRLVLILAAYAALTVSAIAQAPLEIVASDTIRLHPGEARLFTIDQPYTSFHFTDDKTTVELTIDTNQRFTLRGLKSGTVLMSIYGRDERLIHRSNVIVAGGLVRIYGTDTQDEKKSDYVGYICSETGCGRADPEIERRGAQSVAVTRRDSRGNIITTTTNR